MKKYLKLIIILILLSLCVALLVAYTLNFKKENKINLEPGIYINGRLVELTEGINDLTLLSVENGLTVQVVTEGNETVYVNDKEVEGVVNLDISAITRDEIITIDIENDDNVNPYIINLMPSTFPDYTTEGESVTDGDFYLSTYDLTTNYIFKLNNKGELIFYKTITKLDDEGNEVNTNGIDFRKQYTSNGEIRYTYMPYLQDAFADGDCTGINPGAVIVMDENYDVIDEIYYIDENNENRYIDPHGFIWIDENNYIVSSYVRETVKIPGKIDNVDSDTIDLAVLYIQEIKNGEVIWEFSSSDYEKFIYESNAISWKNLKEKCYDYVHFNSMCIDNDGNLLVSCRQLDAILKISREDGSLIWQLGGDYDEFGLTDDQKFSYQHSIILNEDGGYMLFDNANDANSQGKATSSSVLRISVDEETKSVVDFIRYSVINFFSNYMGAIREIDHSQSVYLWSVGGNFTTDSVTPPEWSMVEYKETEEGTASNNFCFRFNEGTRRLYCSNKCK